MTYTKNGQDILESYEYDYDKNSNIVSETHVNNLEESKINETKTYTYDVYGRLTKTVTADHSNNDADSTVTYSYDSVGNRTGLTDSTGTANYTYNGLNQLTEKTDSSGTTTYTYDGRGNQIKDVTPTATTNFIYAVTGEMLTVASGSAVIQENEYNHEGIRISKSEDGTERKYLYDNGSVVYTIDNESVSSANVLGGYQNVVGSYRGEDYYTYSKDAQGSTSSITDGDFTASAIYEYSDFGEVTEVVESIDNEICYTGAIHDETTGLHYMNARYYDPANGRFISQDSYRGEMNDLGQWHLYVYCANNPINYTDPRGHYSINVNKTKKKVTVKISFNDIEAWGLAVNYCNIVSLKLSMQQIFNKKAKPKIPTALVSAGVALKLSKLTIVWNAIYTIVATKAKNDNYDGIKYVLYYKEKQIYKWQSGCRYSVKKIIANKIRNGILLGDVNEKFCWEYSIYFNIN